MLNSADSVANEERNWCPLTTWKWEGKEEKRKGERNS